MSPRLDTDKYQRRAIVVGGHLESHQRGPLVHITTVCRRSCGFKPAPTAHASPGSNRVELMISQQIEYFRTSPATAPCWADSICYREIVAPVQHALVAEITHDVKCKPHLPQRNRSHPSSVYAKNRTCQQIQLQFLPQFHSTRTLLEQAYLRTLGLPISLQ